MLNRLEIPAFYLKLGMFPLYLPKFSLTSFKGFQNLDWIRYGFVGLFIGDDHIFEVVIL